MWTAKFFFFSFSFFFLGAGGAEGNYRLMDYTGSRGKTVKKDKRLNVCCVEKALGWSSAGEGPNKDYSDLILAVYHSSRDAMTIVTKNSKRNATKSISL